MGMRAVKALPDRASGVFRPAIHMATFPAGSTPSSRKAFSWRAVGDEVRAKVRSGISRSAASLRVNVARSASSVGIEWTGRPSAVFF